jgi:DNA-binding MarR family transcriptional regulator
MAAGGGDKIMKSSQQTQSSPNRGKSRNSADDSIATFMAQWRAEKPGLDVSPLGVLGRIQRLSIYFRDRAEQWLKPMELTWESFSILAALRRSGKPYELRPTDMYREALLSSGAITNRIDGVERKGWVERRPDTADRRVTIVRLTPAGKAVIDKALEMHFREMAKLMERLPRADREELGTLLGKLLTTFESERAETEAED